MMAGNPSWWSMDSSNLRSSSTSSAASDHHHHHQQQQEQQQEEVALNFLISQTHPNNSNNNNSLDHMPLHQYLQGSTSSSSPSSCTPSPMPFISSLLGHDPHPQHHFPHSWSQLLLGGMGSDNHQQEEMRFGPSLFQSTRVMSSSVVDVKEEVNSQIKNNNNNLYGFHHDHDHDHHNDDDNQNEEQEVAGISKGGAWYSQNTLPASSPKSCVTSLSSTNNNNILDFSTSTKRSLHPSQTHQHLDHSNSECNSSATGGAPSKKPKVQPSSNPPLKVRKEKLGDRITSLHQLVSPFGKTDTASVLLEAIGYIRFLQAQIQALSSPYLGGNNASAKHPNAVHGERSCLFPNHQGELLNDSCLKRSGAANQGEKREAARDLKSRGLCLVPISCTQLVGSENGADYWAPSLGGGF